MHAGVFEAGWASEGVMPRHRAVVSGAHRERGLEVMSLDWTDVHPDRGPKIDATQRAYDYVEGGISRHQTRVTAVDRVRQLEVEGHFPQAHDAFDKGGALAAAHVVD